MAVLVACEESQVVTIALRNLKVEAYSCDLLECSGGHPEWHIRGDVIPLLKEKWTMIIAFPPCTHLAASGARYFEEKRKDGRQLAAIQFFMQFVTNECEKIAIENPVGIMSTIWRKPDQIVNPYQFGHKEQKATCLWLKNLTPLLETKNVKNEMLLLPRKEREKNHRIGPSKNRSLLRSKTYLGIAEAMAQQWEKEI